MLFNSFQFMFYFCVVVGIYFLFPHRFRWIILLAASYYFYMSSKPEYILLVFVTTCITYLTGIKMGHTEDKQKRMRYLLISLFLNLGILFIFKYFNFFNASLRTVFQQFNLAYEIPDFKLLLPAGISFYTFQSLSYSIDVYKGKAPAEKHFGILALYVSFFPQLLAGPIERPNNMIPQYYKEKTFSPTKVAEGLKRIAWGLFKKIVIADRLAVMVNTVYNKPSEYQGMPLILATFLFSFQIYCDFSGYSDIAVGTARILGISLMENFKRPYFSKSITEFWRRWHVSLSSWFKEYLYIPLGGNRVSKARSYLNLFIVFLVSGLWHGASVTFLIWGALHGLYNIVGKFTHKTREGMNKALKLNRAPLLMKCFQAGITFCLVTFAWIFFKASTLTDALYIVKNMFVGIIENLSLSMFKDTLFSLGLNRIELIITFFSLVLLEIVHLLQRKKTRLAKMLTGNRYFRWVGYYLLVIILLFCTYSGTHEFVYFQF